MINCSGLFVQKLTSSGFCCNQTPNNSYAPKPQPSPPPVYVERTDLNAEQKKTLVTWFLLELKVGHRKAKFAREAITAWAKRYVCLTKLLDAFGGAQSNFKVHVI